MLVPTRALRSALAIALALLLAGCSGLTLLGLRHEEGLEAVGELLSYVERVQVEATATRERTQAAVESLRALVAPEFKGDPVVSHGEFEAAVDLCGEQAKTLRRCVRPLKEAGEDVLTRWAENLQSFGNLAMRQRSQERLEETRRRYEAILSTAGLSQLALDTFHRDLADQALFLEHDFNASSVALVAQELDGLKGRARELARRLDACAAACQAYLEFSAPSAQVAPASEAPAADPVAPAPIPTPKKPDSRKKPPAQTAPTSAPRPGG